MKVSGSWRKLSIAGIEYDVAADIDATVMPSGVEKEGIATSGQTLQKVTKRVEMVENVTIIANGEEQQQLKDVAEALELVPLTYTEASGDTYRATGFINIGEKTTAENRMNVTLIPQDTWTPFLN